MIGNWFLFLTELFLSFEVFPYALLLVSLHKKWSYPLRISSVNLTKSAANSGFGHIYWRNLNGKLRFLCRVLFSFSFYFYLYIHTHLSMEMCMWLCEYVPVWLSECASVSFKTIQRFSKNHNSSNLRESLFSDKDQNQQWVTLRKLKYCGDFF